MNPHLSDMKSMHNPEISGCWRFGGRRNGKWLLNGYGMFTRGDEKVLELDSADGCATL